MNQDNSSNQNRQGKHEFILSWGYWFGEIDTRWLAIFRILLSLLLLKDAIYHLFLARRFYSDDGLVPRWALFDGLVREPRFSLMDAIGEPWLAFLFFCLWILVLICLIIGYRSRLMAILNFILILSIHERNGYILTSADTLMRAMSFWMMFAPIAQYYAVDALKKRLATGDENPQTSFALPMRLIQLQLVLVYCSTAFLKFISPIWREGEAMHYVVQIDTFILPFGEWMRTWSPELLKMLSYYSMYAELAIPILLLMPFVWRWSRALAFILALILHGGIAVSLSIQDFSILMLICYLPFFDPAWLIWIENRLKPVVDGNKFAMRFAHSSVGQYFLSTAPSPKKLSHWQKIWMSVVLIPLFALLIWWNVDATADYTETGIRYPRVVEDFWNGADDIIWYTGLWQFWDMFSPIPIQYDGWIVIEGQFENDWSYDLFTNAPVDYNSPTRWYWGPEMKWEKFEENAYRWQYNSLLRGWASYYCRTINQDRVIGTRLATLQITMVYRNFHAPNEVPNGLQQDQLWFHWCFDEYAPQS